MLKKMEKAGFFNRYDDGFACLRDTGLHAETFSGSPELFFDPLARPKRSK